MSAGPSVFRRARAGLIGAAFLAPFSATRLAVPLTVGRAAALTFAGLLAADLLRERPRRFRLDLPALLLVVAYVGLTAWIFLNMAAWGCNCYGKAGGFFEFATIGLLSLAAIGLEPSLRGPALVATLAGLLLAVALALLDVGALNSGTVDLTQTGGRLSGTYGNANELGFAAALGIPIALAHFSSVRGRAGRLVLAGTILVLAATLVLTYSRGAIIAAGVGILALALWDAKGSRRRAAMILTTAVAAVLVGAVLYSVFARDRREASFESVPTSLSGLNQRDLSGWDSRARGPIPHGPSMLFNRDRAIAVRSSRAGEGASIRWGEADVGGAYTLRFRARGVDSGLPFRYALGDSSQSAAGSRVTGELGTRWWRFSLVWRPRLRSPHANLYLWQMAGPSTFELSDVRVIRRARGRPAHVVTVPGHLEGSLYARLTSSAARAEKHYLQSRLDAAREALRAFASEPLRGIGWATFPAYSASHLHYGPLAAHNQYLSFAAELGIVGILFMSLLIAAVAIGVKGSGLGRPEAAAIGMLASTAAGMFFVEALPVPQLSIPIALAAAIVCAPRRSVLG